MNAKRMTAGIAIAAAALLATGGTAMAAGGSFDSFFNQDIGMTDAEIAKLAEKSAAEDEKLRAENEAAPQPVKISDADAAALDKEFADLTADSK